MKKLIIAPLLIFGLIAAASEPQRLDLILSVTRANTNFVFHITNVSSNAMIIPSSGYAISSVDIPVNTNPAFALFDEPETCAGLWLTRDWRHVGNEWMLASHDQWTNRLAPRTLAPGTTIDIIRPILFFEERAINRTNGVLKFTFAVPKEWAQEFNLWRGYLCVTGLTETIEEPTKVRTVPK